MTTELEKPIMLILRGLPGNYDGRHWPHGALYEGPALEFAYRKGFIGEVVDLPGDTTSEPKLKRKQVAYVLDRIRSDPKIQALYGFSAGGYNIKWILELLEERYRQYLKLVVLVGAPGARPRRGSYDLIIFDDPPQGHMQGPQALLNTLEEPGDPA